ncbi:MAG: helix-hairpin-helix domain-containing protein [Gaiellaceae bacterium]
MLDVIARFVPASRRRALALAALALVILLIGARSLAGSRAPSARAVAAPVAVEDAPRRTLTVHVVGAVRRAGLYHLSEGSRVADAVARAGGATRKADLASINLAAPLADGLQVLVPRRVSVAASSHGGEAGTQGPVHLNNATIEQLDALPGVGPVTAQKIVEYREQNGAFTSVDDLDAVSGIGPARLESLRELVAP